MKVATFLLFTGGLEYKKGARFQSSFKKNVLKRRSPDAEL